MGPRDDDGVRVTLSELAGFLGAALGDAKALEVVESTARSLGYRGDQLTRSEALNLLEQVADTKGIVGVAARFAKSRLHLKWATSLGS